MIKLRKKDLLFADIYFVSEAASRDTIKPVYSHIYADADFIVATDGRRMHRIKNDDEWEQGFYEIVSKKKNEIILHYAGCDIGTFPDHNQFKGIKDTKNYICESSGSVNRLISDFCTFFYIKYNQQICMDLDLLKPLEKDSFRIFATGALEPVLFENDTEEAVIMPIKIK